MLLARPGAFVLHGALLMLLGLGCLALPKLAAVSATLLCGITMVLGGAVLWVFARLTRGWPGFRPTLFSALILLLLGLFVVTFPPAGILSIGVLLTLALLLDGFLKLYTAFAARGVPGYGWYAFHGLIALGLAGMVIAEWPTSATWLIGLLIGLHFLLKGWTLVVLGLATRASERHLRYT